MDLIEWIAAEHHGLVERFDQSIVAHVPRSRWRERVDGSGSSIAHLVFHTCLHADLAVNAVVFDRSPLIDRHALGIDTLALGAGLGEAEDVGLSSALDLDALAAYVDVVNISVGACVASLDVASLDDASLDDMVDASTRLALNGGVSVNETPWLHRMWTDKPLWWFIQWEAIGHRVNHLGEMISVRSRMGLSPF